MTAELSAILAANQEFYEAFAKGDLARMDRVWAQRAPVVCIHPGWGALTERAGIMQSWRNILGEGGAGIRAVGPRVFRYGALALVVLQEMLPGGMLMATNGFVQEDGGWRMVLHQAGPLSAIAEEPPSPARN
ncbi:MAG: nuclear transport factor 2 family protein [Alphaproteobacteria bacterium]|nr:nuclear transport factor 2 family protein [Alphaproteobacteria bacterium]